MATSATAIIPVPTLSLDGWVKDSLTKADYLMAHFFESEQSQTAFYTGQVASLQGIIQANGNDMSKTADAIRETLTEYFSRYFPRVQCGCSYRADPPNSSSYVMEIDLSFADVDGKQYGIERVFTLLNSKFEIIKSLNNSGQSF